MDTICTSPLLFLESHMSASDSIIVPKNRLRKQLSPLRYPGGKSKVIDQIAACLNREKLEIFVEVFAGGASLGLSLLDAGWVHELHLNEYDSSVYNFWDVVCTHPDALIERLRGPLPTLEEYFQAKERLRAYKQTSACDVTAAYDFLLLNRTSFAGIILANPIGGKHGSDEKMRARWNPQTLIRRISRIAEMSQSIILTYEDAVSYLSNKKFQDSKKTTIFIDPPYTRAGKQLYPESFEGRHEELAEKVRLFMERNSGSDVVITYDDCPFVRSLYPGAEIRHLSTSWSIYREQPGIKIIS